MTGHKKFEFCISSAKLVDAKDFLGNLQLQGLALLPFGLKLQRLIGMRCSIFPAYCMEYFFMNHKTQ